MFEQIKIFDESLYKNQEINAEKNHIKTKINCQKSKYILKKKSRSLKNEKSAGKYVKHHKKSNINLEKTMYT